MSKQSELIRVEWRKNDTKRDEGLKTPDYIIRDDNIFYGENREWQKLDVYRHKNASKKMPVIVNVHGGGWVYGDKDIYQFYCMSLVQYGFTVVNYSYRLAPEYKYPANIEDTNLVFEFIVENAEKYGFDLDNIFALGDSAGGNILGIYSNILTNLEYRKKYNIEIPKIKNKNGSFRELRLNAIALNCAALSFIEKKQPETKNELMEDLFTNGGTDEELSLIDVVNYVTKDFPPTFLMTSSEDFLSLEIFPMIKALLERQVSFETKYWHDSKVPCPHVFHVDCRHPFSVDCNRMECEFFLKNLVKN